MVGLYLLYETPVHWGRLISAVSDPNCYPNDLQLMVISEGGIMVVNWELTSDSANSSADTTQTILLFILTVSFFTPVHFHFLQNSQHVPGDLSSVCPSVKMCSFWYLFMFLFISFHKGRMVVIFFVLTEPIFWTESQSFTREFTWGDHTERTQNRFLLWMCEVIDECDLLHQVSSDGSHQFVEVVFSEALLAVFGVRQPKGDIVVEGGVLTQSLRRHKDLWKHKIMNTIWR